MPPTTSSSSQHNGTTGATRPAWSDRPRRAAPASDPHRERTITRLAVLKAAAQFASTRPQATSADVLTVAAAWVRWVDR